MNPDRQKELARQLGLDGVPKLRYEEAPDENPSLDHQINFRKAVQLIDPIRTAAFEGFIPEKCVIDQEMDGHVFVEGKSDALLIRTDVPPPVDPRFNAANRLVTRATKIPFRLDDRAFFIWLGCELDLRWISWGARRMAPPLIFAGRGDSKVPGARPFIGLILQFARGLWDAPADWGAIVPVGDIVKEEHRVMPVDSGSTLTPKIPE